MFWLWHPSLTAINLSYTFPILETSATALCGTTGITFWSFEPSFSYDVFIILFPHIEEIPSGLEDAEHLEQMQEMQKAWEFGFYQT